MTEQPEHCVKSCDICTHAEKTNSPSYPFKCGISKPIPMLVHECCVRWFGYVGCASHSSRPANTCPHWKSTANLKSDCRDQGLGDFYCSKHPRPNTDALDILPLLMYCRNVINTDKSGLAPGLAKIQRVAEGYNWIPRGEWGDYDYSKRTTKTLQKEVGYLIQEIALIAEQSLRESGERVNANVREVERAMSELRQQQGGKQI